MVQFKEIRITIIVARYNENVEWTKQFPNVIIYNKGDKLPDGDGYNEIALNNVGREGHTYYTYICDYDDLNDYTVFLQGNPFDHSPHIIDNLTNLINGEMNISFAFLSEWILPCNLNCRAFGLSIKDTYEKIFGTTKIERDYEFIFGAGAQFIVSKEQILKRPKCFYSRIVELLEYDIDPKEGYEIERLHKLIFE